MGKSVEIECPARLTLFLNSYQSKNIKKFNLINQTVDIYDKLTISEDKKKYEGIKIISKDLNIQPENNICYKAAKLFFEYTGITPNTFNIYLEKNIPIKKGFAGSSSLAAGVLKGLNEYYHTNLTKKELMLLAIKLGEEVPYFIVSGYASINDEITNVKRLHDNPYQSYLIVEPKNLEIESNEFHLFDNYKIIRFDDSMLYNEFSKNISSKLLSLENYIKSHTNSSYNLLARGPVYFIGFKQTAISASLMIKLKKEYPNFKVYYCRNSSGHKILTKYPTINL